MRNGGPTIMAITMTWRKKNDLASNWRMGRY